MALGGIFYPLPAYRQTPVIECGYGNLSLSVTEQIVREVISIPVHPQLTQAELETVAREVNKL